MWLIKFNFKLNTDQAELLLRIVRQLGGVTLGYGTNSFTDQVINQLYYVHEHVHMQIPILIPCTSNVDYCIDQSTTILIICSGKRSIQIIY